MADGLNLVYVMGNLGEDPTLRQAGETSVLTLSIACNSSYLDRNRVRQETVEWVRVVIFGRRADALAKFLKKGARVFCEGQLRTTSWEDREGIKRWKTEVIAKNVILGGSNNPRKKPEDPERRRPSRRDEDDDQDYPADGSAPASGGGYGGGNDDDSIPF
jgi:single-strand DNA-binding protein